MSYYPHGRRVYRELLRDRQAKLAKFRELEVPEVLIEIQRLIERAAFEAQKDGQ